MHSIRMYRNIFHVCVCVCVCVYVYVYIYIYIYIYIKLGKKGTVIPLEARCVPEGG